MPKKYNNIYEISKYDRGFNGLLFSYIFGIMSENYLEENEVDFEMFKIIFLTNMQQLNMQLTSDLVKYYEDDLRGIYFAYFKFKTLFHTSDKTIKKIIARMKHMIIFYDLSPTEVDFENCLDLIDKEFDGFISNELLKDILRYKKEYLRQCYYNMVTIIHNMKGE